MEDVIWTLEMFVRVLTESTEKQLRDVGHYLPKQKAEVANYFMVSASLVLFKLHFSNWFTGSCLTRDISLYLISCTIDAP